MDGSGNISPICPVGSMKTTKTLLSGFPPKFSPGTSHIRSRVSNLATVTFVPHRRHEEIFRIYEVAGTELALMLHVTRHEEITTVCSRELCPWDTPTHPPVISHVPTVSL
jgi:hypothetical protein